MAVKSVTLKYIYICVHIHLSKGQNAALQRYQGESLEFYLFLLPSVNYIRDVQLQTLFIY